jgi:hypothetical protein
MQAVSARGFEPNPDEVLARPTVFKTAWTPLSGTIHKGDPRSRPHLERISTWSNTTQKRLVLAFDLDYRTAP